MTGLLHAHSGLRYLVLLAAAAHLVVCLLGLAKKQPPGKLNRVLSVVLLSLVHTQVLVGLALVGLGRFFPQLWGHLVPMLMAAAAVTVFPAVNKRRAEPRWSIALVGTLTALALVVTGILALGRSPLAMTVVGGP